jgi:uncharacterized protein (DUF427 family)
VRGEALHVERSQKRARAFPEGELVFDTTAALLVWEVPAYPAYYVPLDGVRADLVASGPTAPSKRAS